MTSTASPICLCRLRGVGKSFAGLRALWGVDLDLHAGEIHALVGENGAGKSTLIRCLAGIIQPEDGEILFDGRAVELTSPRAAHRLGVAAAHQAPELFLWRSAAENIFNVRGLPADPFIPWKRVEEESREALRRLGSEIPPRAEAGLLSASQRQVVALAGALIARPRLLILDEPTASLSEGESERLFRVLDELRRGGVCILYVSHRLGEVLRIADRVTVLRDGRVVRSDRAGALDADALVEAMVGRRLEAYYPRAPEHGAETVLEVEDLGDERGAFRGVRLALHRGEIAGLYGLVGAGRTELGQALAGFRRARGVVRARGSVAYLPEDRIRDANLPGLSLRENLTIAALDRIAVGPLIDRRRERSLASSLREKLDIRAPGIEGSIDTLSGGNQQKALLGRWLATEPEILILDEPTQGIDVGARAEIHRLIADLAAGGCGILLISSDLSEVLGMSHRVIVMREGRIAACFASGEAGEEDVGRAALPEERGPSRRHSPDASGPPPPARGAWSDRASARLARFLGQREAALAAVIAAIIIATGWRSSRFLAWESLRDVACDTAPLALAALGQTLVIACGAIDISIGSMLALCAAAAALMANAGCGAAFAVAGAAALGSLLGAVNAAISTAGRLHPIITTLGTLGIYRALFLEWTDRRWLYLPDTLLDLARSGPFGVPVSVWGALIAAGLFFHFLGGTRAGRACLKVGDNPRAALAHGLRIESTRWLAFAILGGCVGLAAVFYTARYGTVQNNTGMGFELQVIAAAVLGGAHVAGGRGTAAGALLGAALIGLLASARPVWGIHERWQLVGVGALMLGALALETAIARLSPGRRP
ncbi:MAG: ATP-binding cassette domain-containing protein [Planctomycetes bacterium]|nr:ATP-binding cassette domain-containing protein [Planctomycetota bacterium]